jgi:hypothetical protein
MKIVVETQYRENYGAHDWDGQGECPQHWKMKGGNTYFVDCTLSEAQSTEYWDHVRDSIESYDDYQEEYILSSTLVDAIDFDPKNYEESEHRGGVYMEKDSDGKFVCQQTSTIGGGTRDDNRHQRIMTWHQHGGSQREMRAVVVRPDGTSIPYMEYIEELRVA